MESNAEMDVLFSLNINTLLAKNDKVDIRKIYTKCIEKRHF